MKETEKMIVASIHVPYPMFYVRPAPYSLKKSTATIILHSAVYCWTQRLQYKPKLN